MGLVFLKSELLGLSTPLWSLPPGHPNRPFTTSRGDLASLGPPGPAPKIISFLVAFFDRFGNPKMTSKMLENRAREAPKTLL